MAQFSNMAKQAAERKQQQINRHFVGGSHHSRHPMDCFGNTIRLRDYLPRLGTVEPEEFDKLVNARLKIWECSTSAYGGDSRSDCEEL